MSNVDEVARVDGRIRGLLRELRDSLAEYGRLSGGPFLGIADGSPTAIRSDLMRDCRAVADRTDLLSLLPKGGVFAEIGNFYGDFTLRILEICQPVELHTFDWNLSAIREENRARLTAHGGVVFHDGDPASHFADQPHGTFDAIYLNKSKDFAGVRRELIACLERLKPLGYLIVNDVTAWDPVQGIPYGVLPAVCQVANDYGLQIRIVSMQARGFLNVALQRA